MSSSPSFKRQIFLLRPLPVILLQEVMVSPGTHLVKNHESQSRTSESQLKNNTSKIEKASVFM